MDRLSPRVVHVADPDAAVHAVRSAGRRVVTFSGFSEGGYEDRARFEQLVVDALSQLDPQQVVVCSGGTAEGIGAVYPLAKGRGFGTIGIVSALAEREGVPFSDAVDAIYVIEDDAWGGRRGDGSLSPTSYAMVRAADDIIAIGGGPIARDELEVALHDGKNVRYEPAEMNHAAALEKARRKGEAVPTDFNGAVHRLFERR